MLLRIGLRFDLSVKHFLVKSRTSLRAGHFSPCIQIVLKCVKDFVSLLCRCALSQLFIQLYIHIFLPGCHRKKLWTHEKTREDNELLLWDFNLGCQLYRVASKTIWRSQWKLCTCFCIRSNCQMFFFLIDWEGRFVSEAVRRWHESAWRSREIREQPVQLNTSRTLVISQICCRPTNHLLVITLGLIAHVCLSSERRTRVLKSHEINTDSSCSYS